LHRHEKSLFQINTVWCATRPVRLRDTRRVCSQSAQRSGCRQQGRSRMDFPARVVQPGLPYRAGMAPMNGTCASIDPGGGSRILNGSQAAGPMN
jgi:hypothetical protein